MYARSRMRKSVYTELGPIDAELPPVAVLPQDNSATSILEHCVSLSLQVELGLTILRF